MIRLWVLDDLAAGTMVEPDRDQAHYLVNVMRLAPGAELALFNGRDGEWRATVSEASKRGCRLIVATQLRPQQAPPDLDLIVALVKRARLETIVEKAAELGARRVRLAITERTNADHTKVARLQAIAVEAAEQTGRLDVPEVLEPQKLDRLLDDLGEGRRLMFCDEAGDAAPAKDALAAVGGASWAVLVGPEGGFSPGERDRIRAVANVTPVTLGPRILRADTAAISAMTLWQATLGDWKA